MNPVEIEFYELLNSGCPDKLYFKYYLIEANNHLKKMWKMERDKLNIEFKKETSWIKDKKETSWIVGMDKKGWIKEMSKNILKKNTMKILYSF